MERSKTIRLNLLFEKMAANSATFEEQMELKSLYEEYINEGREPVVKPLSYYAPQKRYATG